ncbi:death-associated inhibitor of apoptosis 2 [Lepeophtheirus salmonis]|uniref:Inhibitor of apoptosis 2 [Tribolium castaneum] n=1 Tax=Lepeophtheirus salmonis TaxID=72036 RepID=A0A0K2SWB7_LEPSM|nr:putative inhibitor of apoptosis [Lepeophtheirus salmonis]
MTKQDVNMTNPMRYEEMRLSTFKNWPSNAKVEARKIAKAGFFHTGNESEVQCSWCNVLISQWEYGDQVMAKHRYANSNCPFILNISDNVPMILNSSTSDSETNNNDEVDIPPQLLRIRSYSPQRIESFKSETSRFSTFEDWPLSYIDPSALARSGFIYSGRGDCVRCVFCGEYVGDWDRNDDPEEEHRNLFSHCPFVRGLEVGNIPISRRPFSSSPSSTDFFLSARSSAPSLLVEGNRGYDEVGMRPQRPDNERPYGGTNNSNKVLKIKENPKSNSEESIGIIKHTGPVHPKYSTVESRLRTFAEWPPALVPRPKELSDAGFYYIGLSDQVKCFSCDGGLRNWTPQDDPWTEHARWFSKCGFVRLIKGDEFIQECIVKKPTTESDPLTEQESGSGGDGEDEKITNLMSTSIVNEVLSMGIDPNKVKSALKKKVSETGIGFSTSSQLMDAAFGVKRCDGTSTNELAAERVPKTNVIIPPSTETTSSISTTVAIPPVNNLSISPKLEENAEVGSDLESENRMLKEQRQCKICMDNEIGVVFLPCGHLICCTSCAPALQDCPLCRTSIKGTVKTYMS